jgi:hypothetical protein
MADGVLRIGTRFALVFGGVVYAKPRMVIDAAPL